MTTAFVHCADDSRETLHKAGEEAARLAIQRAFRGEIALESVVIEKDAMGKPYGRVHGDSSSIAVSISHSFPYALAAAVVHDVALGVDIERIRRFAASTAEAFLTPSEKKIIACAPADERAYLETLAWSLKEAVLKALGVGLRMHPRHIDLSALLSGKKAPFDIYIRDIPHAADVRFWRIRCNYVVAVVALSGTIRYPVPISHYGSARHRH